MIDIIFHKAINESKYREFYYQILQRVKMLSLVDQSNSHEIIKKLFSDSFLLTFSYIYNNLEAI